MDKSSRIEKLFNLNIAIRLNIIESFEMKQLLFIKPPNFVGSFLPPNNIDE